MFDGWHDVRFLHGFRQVLALLSGSLLSLNSILYVFKRDTPLLL